MKAAAVFSSIEDADAEFELVTRSSDFSNFRFVFLEGYNSIQHHHNDYW